MDCRAGYQGKKGQLKILFVNQTFYPDLSATAQQLTDLALGLSKTGHQVSVLTAQRGYVKPQELYPPAEIYQGIDIIRVWRFSLGRKSKWLRLLDAALLNLAFFLKMLWLPKADIVVALTSPPLVGFFACWVARLKRSKFIYWVMDMNPDEVIAMGWIGAGGITARLLETVSQWILKRSDKIVVLDRFMQKRVINKGALGNRVTVIAPWSHDGVKPMPHEKNPFRKQYGLENQFVVMYSGNHSVCHPLDTLLEAARELQKEPGIRFVFIGGGARTADVRNFKQKYGLENILQLEYQPRAGIPQSLSAADIHTVVMGENMAGIVHPSKIYGILALGRPFLYIGPRESHVTDLLNNGAIGYSFLPGEVSQVVKAIQQAKSLSAGEREAIRQQNTKVAASLSKETQMPRILDIFSSSQKGASSL